jgi:ABC-2 type transport system permease protein
MNPRRLRAVAWKEFVHVVRDWRSLTLSLAIPLILILLFGYALNLDLDDVPTVVWDQSRTPESRELLGLVEGSPYFSVVGYRDNYRDLQDYVSSGRAMLAIVVPGDFADKVLGNESVDVQVIADASDPMIARLALNYTTAIGYMYNRRVSVERMRLLGRIGFNSPLELAPRAWYNVDLKSTNNLVPGIIVIVMVVIAAMLTSVTVAKEWELGTMEQLISTPIRAPEVVFGKVAPYFTIGLVDVAIAVFMGQWLFHVPLRGSVGLLFALASIFLAGALFFGLQLSIRLKKQVLANQMAILSSFVPTMILSGFVFAIDNMPRAIQILTYVFPARYFLAILRGIYLKGIGLEILWVNALLLTLYAVIMIISANRGMKLKLN